MSGVAAVMLYSDVPQKPARPTLEARLSPAHDFRVRAAARCDPTLQFDSKSNEVIPNHRHRLAAEVTAANGNSLLDLHVAAGILLPCESDKLNGRSWTVPPGRDNARLH